VKSRWLAGLTTTASIGDQICASKEEFGGGNTHQLSSSRPAYLISTASHLLTHSQPFLKPSLPNSKPFNNSPTLQRACLYSQVSSSSGSISATNLLAPESPSFFIISDSVLVNNKSSSAVLCVVVVVPRDFQSLHNI